nr:retrovirus-related Pol polyprotein from transposon TNT 1-94 [Tanacetum cinerariifolium]
AERLSRTFRAKSTGIRAEALKMLWADSAAAQMKCDITFEIRRVTRCSKTIRALRIVGDQMKNTLKTEDPPRTEALRLHMYEDPPESPGICKESVHWKKAIIKEMVSLEKNQTCSLVRLPVGKKASQRLWMFKVKEEHDGSKRAKSTGIRAEALKMLWADSVMKDVCGKAMKCTFIGSSSDEVRYNFRDTKSHQVIRSRDITFVDSIYGARYATNSSSLTKPIQKSQVVLVDIPKNLAENDSIVAEHGFRLPVGKKASQRLWMFKVKEEHDGSKRYKARLVVKGFQQKRGVDYNEILSLVVKMTIIKLVLSIVAAGAFLCGSLE